MKKYIELVNKSIAASLLIAIGNYSLLKVGEPLGPFLFSLGLLGVCYMGLNLFTGKCGFIIEDKIKVIDILIILVANLLFGYLFGMMFRLADTSLIDPAILKVSSWNITLSYFVKSVLCGSVMYIAVLLYKKGTPLGVLVGVPLFIFSGFQHSIANAITMGVALQFNLAVLLCVAGNFVGSIVTWFLSKSWEIKK